MHVIYLAFTGLLSFPFSTQARVQERKQSRLPEYVPVRLSYSTITQELPSITPFGDSSPRKDLLNALTDAGIVSISNIPGFQELREEMMRHLHGCFHDHEDDSDHEPYHVYDDGSERKTFSTVTFPGPGGAQPMGAKWTRQTPACDEFQRSSDSFRALVQDVTTQFARRLTAELGTSIRAPLMKTQGNEHSFPYLEDVVTQGHHLEHFHLYRKQDVEGGRANMESAAEDLKDDVATIDLHTDQGFFIAFTPGVFVTKDEHGVTSFLQEPDASTIPSSGFQILLSDGTRQMVTFHTQDHLVFMMGDGVNQYINPHLYQDGENNPRALRATPHALYLPTLDNNVERLWYGRMILPPPGAYSIEHAMTYGDIRSRLLETSTSIPRGIGCSSTHMDVRQLEDTATCAPNSTYCWHRCMSWADYNISQEICESQDLAIQCVNPRGQNWTFQFHGDYYPACSNTTAPNTAFEYLPNYPRNATTCGKTAWETFRSKNAEIYAHSYDLSTNDTSAYFMWSVLPDNKTISGRLSFNGLFGFLAIGFRNINDLYLKGMLGAKILLALPGGNYSAATGLDLSLPSSLKEYQIDNTSSSFRFWNAPKSEDLLSTTSYSIEKTDCFTSISFRAESISGQQFNVSGSDSLIWAANDNNIFVGYHGLNRGRFAVEWKTGNASPGNTVIKKTTTSSSVTLSYNTGFMITMLSVLVYLLI